MEKGDLRFLGRRVTGEDLSMIQEIVTSCGGLTRMELASTVCELLGWKRRSRSLKARECREFLEKLDAKGLLMLPEKRAGRPVGSRAPVWCPGLSRPERRLPWCCRRAHALSPDPDAPAG